MADSVIRDLGLGGCIRRLQPSKLLRLFLRELYRFSSEVTLGPKAPFSITAVRYSAIFSGIQVMSGVRSYGEMLYAACL